MGASLLLFWHKDCIFVTITITITITVTGFCGIDKSARTKDFLVSGYGRPWSTRQVALVTITPEQLRGNSGDDGYFGEEPNLEFRFSLVHEPVRGPVKLRVPEKSEQRDQHEYKSNRL